MTTPEKTLAGKTFILTGASRGIGAATAVELCRRGAVVIGPHRDPGKSPRANEVATEAEQAGGQLVTLVADVTKPEDRAELLQTTIRQFGKIDGIIFNHAGGLEKGADLEYSLQVNGISKITLFEEAERLGALKDRAVVIDISSLWSKFYCTGIKQMAVYEPVARGKKLGEKLLRGVIRLHNEKATDGSHIKFGQVCGQGVGGTITMKLLHRLYPNEVAEIKQAAEGGKLPEIADMAQAITEMARGDFRDEETVFVGVPQITRDEMPAALPMYSPRTRYIDSLIGLDKQRTIGFYRVQDKDTRSHFSFSPDGLIDISFNAGNDDGELTINEAHTAGHFTSEFNLLVFPGHKIVAAALEVATVNLEDTSDDFIIPRLESIREVKFRVPVLPGDKLRFVPTETDFLVRVGSIEVTTISGLKLGPRNFADPKNMTPDRLIEAGAQTLGLAYIRSINLTDVLPLLGGIRGPIEYQREILPGELLEMEAVITDGDDKEFNGDVTFWIDDKVVAQATGYTCQLRSKKSIERGIRMGRRILS